MPLPLRRLGRSDLLVSPIGLGCWQFSQRRGWNKYWPKLPEREIEGIVAASLDGGVNWFDTAEAYGDGASEEALSRVLQKAGKKPGEIIIATKWMPLLRTAAGLPRTIGKRLECLAPYPIDLYQIHHPGSFSSTRKQMEAMASLVREKKIRCAGVSNFGAKILRPARPGHRKKRRSGRGPGARDHDHRLFPVVAGRPERAVSRQAGTSSGDFGNETVPGILP